MSTRVLPSVPGRSLRIRIQLRQKSMAQTFSRIGNTLELYRPLIRLRHFELPGDGDADYRPSDDGCKSTLAYAISALWPMLETARPPAACTPHSTQKNEHVSTRHYSIDSRTHFYKVQQQKPLAGQVRDRTWQPRMLQIYSPPAYPGEARVAGGPVLPEERPRTCV